MPYNTVREGWAMSDSNTTQTQPPPMPPEPTMPADQDAFCPQCDYNIRGVTLGRCPECGREFDPDEPLTSGIAWTSRKSLGRVRAYVRTWAMATFRPGRLVQAASRPQPIKDARRFRTVTITLTVLLLAAMAAATVYARSKLHDRYSPSEVKWRLILVGIAGGCAWIGLMAASNVVTWFAGPGTFPVERRNRAIAASYYTVAPTLLWVVPARLICLAMGQGLEQLNVFVLESLLVLTAGVATIAVLVYCGLLTPLLVARMTKRTLPGWLLTVLLMPVAQVVAAALAIAPPLALAFYGRVMSIAAG